MNDDFRQKVKVFGKSYFTHRNENRNLPEQMVEIRIFPAKEKRDSVEKYDIFDRNTHIF